MTHASHIGFRSDETFHDQLIEQFRRAPWLLLSGAVHGLVIIVLLVFIGDPPARLAIASAKVEMEKVEPVDEMIDEKPPEIPEDPEADPVDDLVEPAEELVDQSDDQETWEERKGEEDLVSDKKFDSRSNGEIIGVGDTGGGGFGSGRGGDGKGGRPRGPRRDRIVCERGLEWLARHQSPDGSWDCDGFMRNGDPALGPLCDGKGSALYDVGVTGLALLCFLGAGETHKAGTYRQTVARGLKWLMEQQDAEGCFGSRSVSNFSYAHAIAALAMTEAWGMTRSPLLARSAEQGIAYVQQCQNPYKAWRYKEADGQNDTSVTGWMLMALKSAKLAGMEIEDRRFAWALDFIEEMTDQESGRTGYLRPGEPPVRETGKKDEFPAEESESLTAVAVLSRVFCGQDPAEHRMVKLGAELLAKKLPVWDRARGSIDMYYWYYGTLAMFQVGGEHWRRWNAAMTPAIIETQRLDGNFAGSWDPVGAWGEVGGRVYATALMTLSLEVYYRYGRVFGTAR